LNTKSFIATILGLATILLVTLILVASHASSGTTSFYIEHLTVSSNGSTVDMSNLDTIISNRMLDELIKANNTDASSETNQKLDLLLNLLGAPTK